MQTPQTFGWLTPVASRPGRRRRPCTANGVAEPTSIVSILRLPWLTAVPHAEPWWKADGRPSADLEV